MWMAWRRHDPSSASCPHFSAGGTRDNFSKFDRFDKVSDRMTAYHKLQPFAIFVHRSAKADSKTLLPFHQNDLEGLNTGEKEEIKDSSYLITANDLEAITTEILNLEKANEPQSKNVKGATPSKPKPLTPKHKLNKNNNSQKKPLNTNARDYGNFDFCVVKDKSVEAKGRKEFSAPPEVTLNDRDESFPRRRRPVNGFQSTSSSTIRSRRRRRSDSEDSREYYVIREKEAQHSTCKTCLCALLLSVSFIVLALLVFLHPSVQIYIRSHIHYINPLNSPV